MNKSHGIRLYDVAPAPLRSPVRAIYIIKFRLLSPEDIITATVVAGDSCFQFTGFLLFTWFYNLGN